MLNNFVLSFYDNFGKMFKDAEDKTTNRIENWSLSTSPRLTDASSRGNLSQYPHKSYIGGN